MTPPKINSTISVGNLLTLVPVLLAIIGGSVWAGSLRSDVRHLENEIERIRNLEDRMRDREIGAAVIGSELSAIREGLAHNTALLEQILLAENND